MKIEGKAKLTIGGVELLEAKDVTVMRNESDVRAALGPTIMAEATIDLQVLTGGREIIAAAWRDYLESLKQLVRERIAGRFEQPTLDDAAGVLAEVITEEVEAGFEFSDEQLEQLTDVLETYTA